MKEIGTHGFVNRKGRTRPTAICFESIKAVGICLGKYVLISLRIHAIEGLGSLKNVNACNI